jgi:hypothetical protein
MSSNPEIILNELNLLLSKPFELTIFGASALNLGFPGNMGELTRDVDLVIPAKDAPEIDVNEDFWKAQVELNKRLEPDGLYMTHIFNDHQVVLTKEWVRARVSVDLPTCDKIIAFRPSTSDLILTKMMRNDMEDKEHISFLLKQEEFTDERLLTLFSNAVLPDEPIIRDIFSSMKNWVRAENDRLEQLRRR